MIHFLTQKFLNLKIYLSRNYNIYDFKMYKNKNGHMYRLNTVKSNNVYSKFTLITGIFFQQLARFMDLSCLKCAVNSNAKCEGTPY